MIFDDIQCEVLEVPGAHNVRDIGGYKGTGGRAVNSRRFLRADGLHALTPEGVAAVRELGVACIIDLRSTMETQQMPDTLRDDGDIAYVHIPMLDYIQSEVAGGRARFPSSMSEMYIGLLENSGEAYMRILGVLADPACRTVMFHCTAGKDRTGLVAMLLLGLAGVSREDIVADYVPSERLFPQDDAPEGLPAFLFESKAETIEAALDHLDKNYGGITAYLRSIGMDSALESALLDKLLGDQ